MGKLAAAAAAIALLTASSVGAQTTDTAPRKTTAFANAAFNRVTLTAGGETRELLGNAFLIFARPEGLGNQTPRLRHWHVVVVTARHVVTETVCQGGNSGNVVLSLLPPANSSLRRDFSPSVFQIDITRAWCDEHAAKARNSAVDMYAFETGFDLPQRALIQVYDLGRLPQERERVSIYGFAPASRSRADQVFQGVGGLMSDTQTGYVASVAQSDAFRLDDIALDEGHSGSPILDADDRVVGVAVRRAEMRTCAEVVASQRAASGAPDISSDPLLSGAEEAPDSCDQSRAARAAQMQDVETAFMVPLMSHAWTYADRRLYESRQKAERTERIDAALDLYRAWMQAAPSDPRKRGLRDEFKRARERLTNIEQIELYARAQGQINNLDGLLPDDSDLQITPQTGR